jgi:hypothetical protein
MANNFSPKDFVMTVVLAGAVIGAIAGNNNSDKTVFAVAIVGSAILLIAGRVNKKKE